VTIVVRTSALQGAVGPTIRNLRQPGRFLHCPIRPRRRASAQKRKRPGALGTRRASTRGVHIA